MSSPQRRKGSRSQKNPPVRRHNYADIRPKKKKTSLAVPILILFVLALVISLIAAAAWQKLQDSASSSNTSSGIPTPPPSAVRTGDGPASPSSIPSMKAGYSQSSPESAPDGEGDAQSGESSQSGDSSGESSSQSTPGGDAVSTVTFGAAVPPSAKVSESYFDDALFIGDSITTGITGYGILNNATVLASKGVNPSSLLNNKVELPDGSKENLLDLAKEENPKKIYIHIGANGVAFIGKETFISLYAQSIQRLKEDHPDAIIYVQSIFPVTKAKADAEPLYSNDKIDAYNLAIMEMTKEQEVYYLNVAGVLKGPDGALPNEVSPADGMHFGPTTYRVWMDYLLSHVVDAEDYPQESSGVESTPSGSSSESQEPSSSSASG